VLAGCLVSGLMVGPVWGVSWEVSTRSIGEGAYDGLMRQPRLEDAPIAEHQRVHPLEIPLVWFGVLLAESAILAPLIWAVVPRTWPLPALVAIWVLALGAIGALNYAIRRRFIPR
jgi:hypothetical protein